MSTSTVAVLALDPRSAESSLAESVRRVAALVGTENGIIVVGPKGVPAARHITVEVTLPSPPERMGALGKFARVVTANLDSRVAWRVLSRHGEAMDALRGADIVVVADSVGHRSGWMLARRHGLRAVTSDDRAVRYAVGSRTGSANLNTSKT